MNNFPTRRYGATLVIALAILAIITLLAVSNMREVVPESRIADNIIEQTHLQNTVESRLREGERHFVNTLRPPKPGAGCTTGNVAHPYLLDLAVPKLRPTDTHQNPVGVPKGIANTWVSYHGNDIINMTTADMLYNMQWNNLPIPSGGQVNKTESPEYGGPVRGIGTFYYETNSVARNQTNSETILRTVLAHLYTNRSSST